MSAVKHVVRNGLDHDGPLYDPGVNTDFDHEGEELPEDQRLITKQSFKDECDINTIMRRYETTGQIDHINRRQPQFGDFTDVASFHDAVQTVMSAEAAFADLPAKVRDEFGNDPARLMEFLADPKNKDRAIELGLVDKPVVEKPTKVEVVNAAPPADTSPPQPKAGDKPASGSPGQG